jgi:cell division septum initiation protein DivIVA
VAVNLARRRVGPLRFGLDADSLGDPVDVVEEGDHLDRIVDARVAPAVASKDVGVSRRDRSRLVREFHGEVAQGMDPRLEIRLPVVVLGVRGKLLWGALGTEVVGMCLDSVVAVVRPGDDDGEELAVGAGQLRGAEHDLPVEAQHRAQDSGAQAYRLDDVEDLACPSTGGGVLARELAGRLPLLDQAYVRHGLNSALLQEIEYSRPAVSDLVPNEPSPVAAVGDRVSEILQAAEEAADQILTQARAQALDIQGRAEEDAATRVRELSAETERLREEALEYARDTRTAVDSYADQHRREAEQEARELLGAAELEAESVRRSTEERAQQLEEQDRERTQGLREEALALEERRDRTLEELREIALDLRDTMEDGSARTGEKSLTSALDIRRRS